MAWPEPPPPRPLNPAPRFHHGCQHPSLLRTMPHAERPLIPRESSGRHRLRVRCHPPGRSQARTQHASAHGHVSCRTSAATAAFDSRGHRHMAPRRRRAGSLHQSTALQKFTCGEARRRIRSLPRVPVDERLRPPGEARPTDVGRTPVRMALECQGRGPVAEIIPQKRRPCPKWTHAPAGRSPTISADSRRIRSPTHPVEQPFSRLRGYYLEITEKIRGWRSRKPA